LIDCDSAQETASLSQTKDSQPMLILAMLLREIDSYLE
jgi:hypothetical protein